MNSDAFLKETLTQDDLVALRNRAKSTLDELVTPSGIYASVDKGWSGPYHSLFGRDSAVTADLIMAACRYGGDAQLARTALDGLTAIGRWQGQKDDPATGEERGKIPHEVRSDFNDVHKVQHAQGTNNMPWFIDPTDNLLKNWDSADATPLWVIAILRLHNYLGIPLTSETQDKIQHGLEWIMTTIDTFDGLLGFLGADLQPARHFSGLHNQGWKDTFQVYQDEHGNLAVHPLKDVLVNAEAWTALFMAAHYFQEINEPFAATLQRYARQLKARFNRESDGFLLPDTAYFAQAIDGNGRKLSQQAADVGICLWANYNSESIINADYVDSVARTITGPGLFNKAIGIRNYALGTEFLQGTQYHGSAHTYWPFVSALVARGLVDFNYSAEAVSVSEAMLRAVDYLGSNIEMFIEAPDQTVESWRHPHLEQQSSVEQAWTAAAVYYASSFVLSVKY